MNQTPVVIFCGGRGIYVDGSGQRRSKALVEVAKQPMVMHVVQRYVAAGFSKFILAAGYQREQLDAMLSTRYAGKRPASDAPYSVPLRGQSCEIRVVDTGLESMTGERLLRVKPYLDGAKTFAVTYSDSLSAIDLDRVQAAHERHGKVATLLGTRVPTRFRILGLRPGDPQVRGFAAKPVIQNDLINGGFYFFDQALFQDRFLPNRPGIVLEESVLESLAAAGELMAFPYEGDWHYLDSERDLKRLEQIASAYE